MGCSPGELDEEEGSERSGLMSSLPSVGATGALSLNSSARTSARVSAMTAVERRPETLTARLR